MPCMQVSHVKVSVGSCVDRSDALHARHVESSQVKSRRRMVSVGLHQVRCELVQMATNRHNGHGK